MKVVKVVLRYFVFASLLGCLSDSVGQTAAAVNLGARISLDGSQGSFATFLNAVSKQTGVMFSFSSKKIPSDKILNLKPGSQSLGEFLNQISRKTGLYYKIVGTHIIFLDKQPVKEKPTTALSKSLDPVSSVEKSKSRDSIPAKTSRENHNISGSFPVIRYEKQGSVSKQSGSYTTVLKVETKEFPKFNKDTQISSTPTKAHSFHFSKMDTTVSKRLDTIHTKKATGDSIGTKENKRSINNHKTASITSDAIIFREYAGSNLNWFIGPQVSRITGLENQSESLKATGLGLNIKMEKFFGKRFSYTLAAGFDHFIGTYTYSFYTGPLRDTNIKRFTIAPVLGGLKYYFHNNFYISAELGPALRASSVTRTKLALSPSAGIMFPLKNSGSIDLALRFTHIVRGYGLLESNTLENGGYSYLSLRAAYGIHSRR